MRLLGSWLFSLVVVGYPLAAIIGVYLGIGSLTASVPFRIIIVVLSVLLIAAALASRRFRFPNAVLLVFFGAYLCRLMYDWTVQGLDGAPIALAWFLGAVCAPVVALTGSADEWDEGRTAVVLFSVGASACALTVLAQLLGLGGDTSTTELGGRLSYEALNPISLGHAAAYTLLAAIVSWRFVRTIFAKVILIVGIVLAAGTLILAGSRGPVAAFVFAMLLFSLTRPRRFFLVFSLLAMFAVAVVLPGDLTLATRLSSVGDESALERLTIQLDAFEQFLEMPWFGSAYEELRSGLYPHNLTLESAMALGIFGLALYFWINMRGFTHAWRSIRSGPVLVPLLFFESFLGAQLSGAIWGADVYWCTLSVLLVSRLRSAPIADDEERGGVEKSLALRP